MSSWFDILILVILIGMNGAFALSEVALITSRRARLQHMDEESVPGARRAMDMNADPNRALSTIQVGITSIGLLSGIFGESALAKPVAEWLVSLGMGEETASAVGITLVVVLLTYFSIVMGEASSPSASARWRPNAWRAASLPSCTCFRLPPRRS